MSRMFLILGLSLACFVTSALGGFGGRQVLAADGKEGELKGGISTTIPAKERLRAHHQKVSSNFSPWVAKKYTRAHHQRISGNFSPDLMETKKQARARHQRVSFLDIEKVKEALETGD